MTLTALAVPIIAALIEHPIAPAAARSPMAPLQRSPAIAASDHDLLAVWGGAQFRTTGDSSYAARLAPDGAPFEEAYPFSSGISDQSPAVVWNGSAYVMARFSAYPRPVGSRPTHSIVFSTIGTPGGDPPGFALDAASYESPSLPRSGTHARMAWNGESYLIVNDGVPVNAFMVDRTFRQARRAFALSEADESTASPDQTRASVTSDGRSFVVTWIAGDPGGFRIEAASVGAAGGTGPPATLATVAAAVQPAAPAIASVGGRELVVWSDGRAVRGIFISPDAAPLGDAFTIFDGRGVAVAAPAIAWNGSVFLVPFLLGDDLYVVRLGGDGNAAASPTVIDDSPGTQSEPAVAASGSSFVVVWNDRNHIRSAAIEGSSGSVANATYLPHLPAQQHDLHAVFDGRQITMAWTEDGEVRVGRAWSDGTLLDGEGVRIGRGAAGPVATNGYLVLVTWEDDDANATRAMLIPNDAPIAASDPFALPLSAQVAMSNGRDFLLTHLEVDGGYAFTISTLTVSSMGSLTLNGNAIKGFPFPPPAGVSLSYGAWSGTRYAIAFHIVLLNDRAPKYPPALGFLDENGRLTGSTALPDGDVYVLAGGSDSFLAGTASGVLTLASFDDAGNVLGHSTIASATVNNIAADGNRFWVSYGTRAQQVSARGQLVGAPFEACPPNVLHASMTSTGRSLVTFYLRAERSAPDGRGVAITRAFFVTQPLPRVRAIRH